MRYFSGNVAREIAHLTGLEGRIWARRYDAILITEEEEATEVVPVDPGHWPSASALG